MDIYLWIDNNREIIRLPVLPNQIFFDTGQDNKEYDGIKMKLKLIGNSKLEKCTISSFFPDQSKEYSFVRDKSHSDYDYVEIISRWKNERIPVRLIIPEMGNKNIAMVIDEFKFGADTTTDVPYTLELSEFTFPQIKIDPSKNKTK
ncbi:hypothetical protein EEL31_23880 [Brevibacillus laterosporus]|nr:hypothetical protein [Brevibacillus laterosporus]TPG71171.1 hypothetical protein EEL31_23880 [Brevibacillus laterosporus]